MTRDALAPFDADVVADVAAEHEVPEEVLRASLRAQQERVRSLRGVDGMVFEYRKAFRDDPVVGRDDRAYYLLVPGHVWPEFGAMLGCSPAELEALRAVHARTLRDAVGDPDDDDDGDRDGDREGDRDRDALVFARD